MDSLPSWVPLAQEAAIDPCDLSRLDRIRRLRRDAGSLLAEDHAGYRRIGKALLAWLDGTGIEAAFGVKPERGNNMTVQRIAGLDRRDAALLALVAAAGCDRLALAWLRGERQCPGEHQDVLDAALAADCPTSRNAVTRARQRHHRHAMRG